MKLSIKDQLSKNNMTRYKLAKKLGLSYPTVDNMYKETLTSAKFSTLEALCKEFSCNLDDILFFDDPELRKNQILRTNRDSGDAD